MKRIFVVGFMLMSVAGVSQNVGIGTTSPAYNLHVQRAGSDASIGVHTTEAFSLANYRMLAGTASTDLLVFGNQVSGNVNGIPLQNLTRLQANSGALMLNVPLTSAIHLSTGFEERMRITEEMVGINTDRFATQRLQVDGVSWGAAFFKENDGNTGTQTVAISKGAAFARFNVATGLQVISLIGPGIHTTGDFGPGIHAVSNSVNHAAGYFDGSAGTGNAIELNGYLKVSGTKTAFVHFATTANTTGSFSRLSYTNQSQTDIIMVTHNYNPIGGTPGSNNHPYGVYWTGSVWAIRNEDGAAMAVTSFNVLVIKN